MVKLLSRIWKDIQAGHNLENYATSFVTLLLVILGILDIVPDRALIVGVLAGVTLLVFNLSKPTDLELKVDDILQNRTKFEPFHEFIKGRRQLWIYAPSGINVLNSTTDNIRNEILTHANGEIRMIVQDPTQNEYLRILTEQLDSTVVVKLHDLPDAIQRVCVILEQMKQWDVLGKVEYRLIKYSPGFSFVAVDPETENGKIVVEFHGAINEQIGSRMHITLTRQLSPYWYDYWLKQYKFLWEKKSYPPMQ